MTILRSRWLALWPAVLLFTGCAVSPAPQECPAGRLDLPDCPPIGAVDDAFINQLYERRGWRPQNEIGTDLVELSKQVDIPTQHARARFLGPSLDAAIDSLAVKLWMIENAEHTIDFAYYIFSNDMIGYAMLGAMCNAVQRGVDVRVVVDSMGSIGGGTHASLRALETCAQRGAGFMRNEAGEITTRKARVQVVIFNSVSKLGNPNRRSHDKILVKDGSFPDKSAVITGGRNISEDYYGIRADGSIDLDTFRDAEILVRSNGELNEGELGVGELSERYASLLFLMPFNKRITPGDSDGDARQYWQERNRAQEQLSLLKSYDYFSPHLAEMDEYMNSGFHQAQVRLAHELGNLTDSKVVTEVCLLYTSDAADDDTIV